MPTGQTRSHAHAGSPTPQDHTKMESSSLKKPKGVVTGQVISEMSIMGSN